MLQTNTRFKPEQEQSVAIRDAVNLSERSRLYIPEEVEVPPPPAYRSRLKRMIDIGLSVAILLLLSPILLLVTLLILLTDGRPILYRQKRVGYLGKRFTVFKFRTMTKGRQTHTRKQYDQWANSHNGRNGRNGSNGTSGNNTSVLAKLDDDPRVTLLGRILRRTSLDEIPQLICVLKGDMSLIGPRPYIIREMDYFTPRQLRRLRVRPGITGLAQVSGRYTLSFEERIDLDNRYIDEWSFWKDVKITFRTVLVLMSFNGR